MILRAENENLKSDNFRLQAAIRNVVCPNCGHAAVLADMSYEEQQLRIENARLKDEVASSLKPYLPFIPNSQHIILLLYMLPGCSLTAWPASPPATAAAADGSRCCRRRP